MASKIEEYDRQSGGPAEAPERHGCGDLAPQKCEGL